MTKFNFHKQMTIIGHHTHILWRGLKYMLAGTLTTGMFVATFVGFHLVSRDSGYLAVYDFIASCFLLLISIASIYLLGLTQKRRGGRYVEKH